MKGKIHIGGRIVDPETARVSVLDRGFLYGDSVYEVLRAYGGVPFARDAHLARLRSSASRVALELPWSDEELHEVIGQTLSASALSDAYVRIIITRGGGPIGLDPGLAIDPQLVVMALEPTSPAPEVYEAGRSAWLVSVQRNTREALDPQAKTGNYMNNVLAAAEARRRGADEAIMLDKLGRVAEGSSANVFALVQGAWCTPPLDVGILSGITRRTVLDLCAREGIPAREQILWPDELRGASEVLVCSTMREIVGIVRIDGEPVGAGVVGTETRRLHALYRTRVRAETGVA